LIEVMGRNSGYLALSTAITSGAEVAIIPELHYNMPRILELLAGRFRNRLSDSIIILSEGVCSADTFIEHLQRESGPNTIRQEVRKTVLGHVQRGGRPSNADRLLASRMGEYAALALLDGEGGSMVGIQKGRLTLVDLEKVGTMKKSIGDELIRLARNLGIEIGDAVEL
jgi:6-phosphofructokinase 1